MSEYTERFVRFGKESSWGSYPSTWENIDWVLAFDATSTEHMIEEDIATVSRQARSRVFVQREVVGSLEVNPLSPKLLYYALGSATSDDTSPYTITITGAGELPSFSIERGLKGASGTFYTGYMGCKIDRLELTVEQGEDVVISVDFAAKDNTFPTYTWSNVVPSGVFTALPFSYLDGELVWGSSTLRLIRVRLEINNNLEARYASRKIGSDPTPVEIREGPQVITGEFIVDKDVEDFAKDVLRARTEGTLTLKIGNDTRGTMEITCNRVALREFSDTVRGREPYEVGFPFVARCSGPSAYDAIEITYYNTIAGTIHDLPI